MTPGGLAGWQGRQQADGLLCAAACICGSGPDVIIGAVLATCWQLNISMCRWRGIGSHLPLQHWPFLCPGKCSAEGVPWHMA